MIICQCSVEGDSYCLLNFNYFHLFGVLGPSIFQLLMHYGEFKADLGWREWINFVQHSLHVS